MPKKVPARQASAQRRPQPQPKRKDVTLVSATSSTEVVTDDGAEVIAEKTETTKVLASKTKPVTAAKPAAAPTAKRPATTAKPGAQPTRALAAARRGARPGQRVGPRLGAHLAVGRQANLVTAEHYRYVLKDLRLIGILAFCAFAILIALTFILPHLLTY